MILRQANPRGRALPREDAAENVSLLRIAKRRHAMLARKWQPGHTDVSAAVLGQRGGGCLEQTPSPRVVC